MSLPKKLIIDDEHVLFALYQLLSSVENLDDEELRVLYSDITNTHTQIAESKRLEIAGLQKEITNLEKEITKKREAIEILEKEVAKWSHIS